MMQPFVIYFFRFCSDMLFSLSTLGEVQFTVGGLLLGCILRDRLRGLIGCRIRTGCCGLLLGVGCVLGFAFGLTIGCVFGGLLCLGFALICAVPAAYRGRGDACGQKQQ